MINERNESDSSDEEKEDTHEKVVAFKKEIIKDLLKKDPLTAARCIKSFYEVYGVVYFKSVMVTLNIMIKESLATLSAENKNVIITNKRKRVLFSTIRQMGLIERITAHEKLYQLFNKELNKHPPPQKRKPK